MIVILLSSLVIVCVGLGLGFLIQGLNRKEGKKSQIGKLQEQIREIELREQGLARQQAQFEATQLRDIEARKLEKETLEETKKNLNRHQEHLLKQEDNLDEKISQLNQREKQLNQSEKELKDQTTKLNIERASILSQLETIAQLSRDEAQQMLMNQLEQSMSKDMANFISKKEEEARDRAEHIARDIILDNISRLATEITAESVVSSVPLSNDEMKGRIIGREGRNIRSLETKTGVDIIIDDTPEAIIISSFDPIRREVARRTLEKLISDGRIQPARIEEVHEKVQEEMQETMKQEGEAACHSLGIHNVHPDLKKYIGRMKFRTSYGQNLLLHSIEVAQLSSMIAGDLGLNRDLAKRGGLIHDIGKVIMDDDRGHVMAGADLAKKLGESDEVINCIMAHHEEVPHSSPESMIVRIADAISAARPGARRDSFERYIERLESLENIALGFKGVEKVYAIQAGREIRVIVNSQEASDADAKILARKIADQIEANLRYPGQIRVTIFRETRFVEYAK